MFLKTKQTNKQKAPNTKNKYSSKKKAQNSSNIPINVYNNGVIKAFRVHIIYSKCYS